MGNLMSCVPGNISMAGDRNCTKMNASNSPQLFPEPPTPANPLSCFDIDSGVYLRSKDILKTTLHFVTKVNARSRRIDYNFLRRVKHPKEKLLVGFRNVKKAVITKKI